MVSKTRTLAWVTLFTTITFAAKMIGGYITNSLALISDAWHLLTDLLSLVISWWALKKAEMPPTPWATYGFQRIGILAALVNNITLVAISGYIFYEAYRRIIEPEFVQTSGMLILAVIGILVNASIVYIVNDGAKSNMNLRSVWLHFLGDVLADLGVLIGSIVIYFTGFYWVDTLLSASLGLLILRGALIMLRDITIILLEGIPSTISVEAITNEIKNLNSISDVRDLHVWCLAEEQIVMSAHIQVVKDIPLSQTEPILKQIKTVLADKFNISHVNIQFEIQECTDCYHHL